MNNEIRAASLAHLWEHPSSISLKPVNTENCPVTSKLIRKSAVLGLHAIKEKPVAINGKVEIRPVCAARTNVWPSCSQMSQMMYLALTYDHRLLDGREAVVFLVKVWIPEQSLSRS